MCIKLRCSTQECPRHLKGYLSISPLKDITYEGWMLLGYFSWLMQMDMWNRCFLWTKDTKNESICSYWPFFMGNRTVFHQNYGNCSKSGYNLKWVNEYIILKSLASGLLFLWYAMVCCVEVCWGVVCSFFFFFLLRFELRTSHRPGK